MIVGLASGPLPVKWVFWQTHLTGWVQALQTVYTASMAATSEGVGDKVTNTVFSHFSLYFPFTVLFIAFLPLSLSSFGSIKISVFFPFPLLI